MRSEQTNIHTNKKQTHGAMLVAQRMCLSVIFPVAQTVKNLPAMQETWVRSVGQEDPLEQGMAILAWRIPWTEEPGGLRSMGSQRVRHDWVTNTATTPINAGDMDSIPGSGRSPGEGNGNSLQHSCLENSMDRGHWWAAVHEAEKNRTRLSTHTRGGKGWSGRNWETGIDTYTLSKQCTKYTTVGNTVCSTGNSNALWCPTWVVVI